MLLLVALNRPLFAGTVRDDSSYDFTSNIFQAQYILDGKNTCPLCRTAHWPGFENSVSVTRGP